MQLKQLLVDDDAVSPVIGVILMVAITVILAAVIGTFVLGIGSNQQTTPQASFEVTFNGSNGTVTHTGGDTFTSENSESLNADVSGSGSVSNNFNVSSDVSTGNTADLTGLDSGDVIRVIWTAPGGGETQELASETKP